MVSSREVDAILDDYDRHFATLSALATELNIPSEEAEELIHDVLTSTLVSGPIKDIDAWLAAAFTSAVNHRGGGAA